MKTTILALLIAALLISGCNRAAENRNGTGTQPAANNNSDTRNVNSKGKTFSRFAPQAFPDPNPTIVTIYLSGLMVFHEESGRPGYEVGILQAPSGHHKHEFHFIYKDKPVTSPGTHWTLEVVTDPPLPGVTAPMIPPRHVGFTKRRPDDINAQNDFDWMIALDGDDFHKGEDMSMASGILKPIIHLPNGQLYTLYKSLDLERCQGGGGCIGAPGGGTDKRTEFGFVSETIAMDLTIGPNQRLILKDDTGASQTLAQYPTPGTTVISISNVRSTPGEDSDFQLYYTLFPKIDPKNRYDFDLTDRGAKNPHRYTAYNRPISKLTCCQMDCTSIRLINSGPLK